MLLHTLDYLQCKRLTNKRGLESQTRATSSHREHHNILLQNHTNWKIHWKFSNKVRYRSMGLSKQKCSDNRCQCSQWLRDKQSRKRKGVQIPGPQERSQRWMEPETNRSNSCNNMGNRHHERLSTRISQVHSRSAQKIWNPNCCHQGHSFFTEKDIRVKLQNHLKR